MMTSDCRASSRPSRLNRAAASRTSTRYLDRSMRDSAQGLPLYERMRDLPRLVSVWPHEIERLDCDGQRALVQKIERVLRAERRRGLAGHWTYDLARHSQLVHALRHERALLTAMERRTPPAGRSP